jgi:hypothetical protein
MTVPVDVQELPDVCVDQLVDEFRAQHRGRFRFKNGLVGFRRNGRGPWLRDDAELNSI